MIIKPIFPKVEKTNYGTMYSWFNKRSMRHKKGDLFYILICSLIITGLTHGITSNIAKIVQKPVIKTVLASTMVTPTPKTVIKYVEVKNDVRAERLKTFLESKGSPMAESAGFIIKTADESAIDWTMLVAIAGKESSYGKHIKEGCFNPFGLGGTKPLCFNSWEDGIDYEANLISEDYRKNMIQGIQDKYCPDSECASDWSDSVYSFATEMLAVDQKE